MDSPTTYHCGSLKYDPLYPEGCDFTETFPEAIQALGHKCRYAGFTDRFYSVLEHSLLCHELAVTLNESSGVDDPAFRMACLLHDVEEAYLDDVPSPRKKLLYYAPNRYDAIHGNIQSASSIHSRNQKEIARQNLTHWKIPQANVQRVVDTFDNPQVHNIDLTIYFAEVSCGHIIRDEIRHHYLYPEAEAAFQSYLSATNQSEGDIYRKLDAETPDSILLRTLFLGKFITEARALGSDTIMQAELQSTIEEDETESPYLNPDGN